MVLRCERVAQAVDGNPAFLITATLPAFASRRGASPSSLAARSSKTQACGYCCMQPELEGAFVPFDAEQVDDALHAWFTGPKYGGTGAMHGLDTEDADRIDEILRAWRPAGIAVAVDRAQLRDSVEAWVHVVIHHDEVPSLFSGFGPYPRSAVLTWTNSD